jgi:predicted DNA-binding antitoxin AbrB/MazE fold protein
MPNSIKAIYEHGVLRPLEELDLGEQEQVEIMILKPGEEIPASALARLALAGKSFAFLEEPEEDVYTLEDGEPV